jgi:hypothetical protein
MWLASLALLFTCALSSLGADKYFPYVKIGQGVNEGRDLADYNQLYQWTADFFTRSPGTAVVSCSECGDARDLQELLKLLYKHDPEALLLVVGVDRQAGEDVYHCRLEVLQPPTGDVVQKLEVASKKPLFESQADLNDLLKDILPKTNAMEPAKLSGGKDTADSNAGDCQVFPTGFASQAHPVPGVLMVTKDLIKLTYGATSYSVKRGGDVEAGRDQPYLWKTPNVFWIRFGNVTVNLQLSDRQGKPIAPSAAISRINSMAGEEEP